MRYQYYISFDTVNFVEFYPTNTVELITKAEEGSFIYRTEVEEIKINKHLNTTIYNTLESWYSDSSKFTTEIHIHQRKGGAVKWQGIFGIKQGRLNKENGYYVIKPETNDIYRIIFQYWKNDVFQSLDEGGTVLIVNETTDGVKQEVSAGVYKSYVKAAMERLLYDSGETINHKSSFLWNDNDPDGNPSTNYDYLLNKLMLNTKTYYTVKDILEKAAYFNCYWYIDANGDLRIEHLEHFEDLINDYAIDLRNENAIVPDFQRIDAEVYSREHLEYPDFVAQLDWDRAIVTYLPARTTFKDQEKLIKTEVYTYVEGDLEDENVLLLAIKNLIGVFPDENFSTWDVTEYIDGEDYSLYIEGIASGAGLYANSNRVVGSANYSYSITVTFNSGTGNLRFKSSSGTTVVLSAGANTGTIDIPFNGYVIFDTTDACNFNMYVRLYKDEEYKVLWTEGVISETLHANGYICPANVLENYYLHGRQSRSGYVNENLTALSSTVYNNRLQEFKVFLEDDIDPLRGVITDYGTARIESYKRDDNDMVTFTLTFQEDV